GRQRGFRYAEIAQEEQITSDDRSDNHLFTPETVLRKPCIEFGGAEAVQRKPRLNRVRDRRQSADHEVAIAPYQQSRNDVVINPAKPARRNHLSQFQDPPSRKIPPARRKGVEAIGAGNRYLS